MKGLSALTEQLRKHRDCEPIVQLKSSPCFSPALQALRFIIFKNFLKLIREALLSNTSYLKHRFPNVLFIGLHSG